MATAGIAVEGVRRSFPGVVALSGADLVAPPGAVTALIGPNGSGKTTLLLILASLLRPDAGSVRVAGIDPVADPRGARRVTGWMPDILGSWETLTVRETLVITGQLHAMSSTAAAARADELITLTAMIELAKRPTRVLSRGQKQKLSLARALVHDPSVLLLDEPASGLDPTARIELRILLRRLADQGRTVLVSSHVLAELDELADGAVYLDHGRTADPEQIARARTHQRQWRIRALNTKSQDLLEVLAGMGVPRQQLRPDRNDLIVSLTDEATAARLLADLVRRQVPVIGFSPAVGDLERTFLGLTGAAR